MVRIRYLSSPWRTKRNRRLTTVEYRESCSPREHSNETCYNETQPLNVTVTENDHLAPHFYSDMRNTELTEFVYRSPELYHFLDICLLITDYVHFIQGCSHLDLNSLISCTLETCHHDIQSDASLGNRPVYESNEINPITRQSSSSITVLSRDNLELGVRYSRRASRRTLRPPRRFSPDNHHTNRQARTLRRNHRIPSLHLDSREIVNHSTPSLQGVSQLLSQIQPPSIREHSAGLMTDSCEHCGASYFKEEQTKGKFQKCCNDGTISLVSDVQVPNLLRTFLLGQHEKSKEFRDNIRRYNNCLSMAAASYQDVRLEGRGVPCVIVNGEVKHLLSPADRGDPGTKLYGECYTIDPLIANEMRTSTGFGSDCYPEILLQLDTIIREQNPFALAYKMMHEKIKFHLERGQSVPSVRMWFVPNQEDNIRRFGHVTVGRNSINTVCNEVTIVYTGEDDIPPLRREICLLSRSNQVTRISTLNRSWESPLLCLIVPLW